MHFCHFLDKNGTFRDLLQLETYKMSYHTPLYRGYKKSYAVGRTNEGTDTCDLGCSLGEIEAYFVEVKTVFKQLSVLEIIHDANHIYYDVSIELFDDYKEKVTQLYGIDCFDSLDLSDPHGTAKKINTFVEEITKGNLKDVICRCMSTAGDAEMMTFSNVTASRYFYYENDEMQRICLPYKNGEYDYEKKSRRKMDVGEISMYIFLPRSRDGLLKLVYDLDGEKLLEWLRLKPLQDYRQKKSRARDVKYKLSVKIPKFTIRTDLELTDTLIQIGLERYFSGNADFSRENNTCFSLEQLWMSMREMRKN
ncbi:serpin (serine protease inhibitor) domain-containing protein [Ditylenchus destructor]|uniref:Serpin (Serine protease inhibitor) domain-containing protein n=1 Tax=Ditylenchus destructor TaxID=166010 RepID=A0AAD4MSP1_9BILA|nr:serpin (serine protease inhibitor) domain-containing protein [Ditylenchus destructor]